MLLGCLRWHISSLLHVGQGHCVCPGRPGQWLLYLKESAEGMLNYLELLSLLWKVYARVLVRRLPLIFNPDPGGATQILTSRQDNGPIFTGARLLEVVLELAHPLYMFFLWTWRRLLTVGRLVSNTAGVWVTITKRQLSVCRDLCLRSQQITKRYYLTIAGMTSHKLCKSQIV